MPQWLETLLTLGGGAALLKMVDIFGSGRESKNKKSEKKTIDETELSRLLLDHNQSRYESVLQDLETVRKKVDELANKVRVLELENLHARHLLGLGPNDPFPNSREEWEAERIID